jgi:hypothetical protein
LFEDRTTLRTTRDEHPVEPGDGTNVAHPLMEAGAIAGMHVCLATPDGYAPDIGITIRAHDRARLRGGSVTVIADVPCPAGGGVHALPPGASRPGDERRGDRRTAVDRLRAGCRPAADRLPTERAVLHARLR